MEEYFQAKRELLLDCNSYGDMVAAYPAYWSGLRCLELVILMDARVLGHIWPGQIMGRDPQIEEWAAATAPDVGALQKLLSSLEDQRAVWSQIPAFQGDGSRSQREEGDASRTPPRVTEVERGSHLEAEADQDQGPGAVTASAISDSPGAPLQPGDAERGRPDARREPGGVSETLTAVPGVPATAAQGGLEPGRGGDLPGGPQPSGREGQPAAGEEGATEPTPRAQQFGRGRERATQPLAGALQSREGGYNTEEEASGSRVQRECTRGPWKQSAERPLAGDMGERATLEPPTRQWERRLSWGRVQLLAEAGAGDKRSQGPNRQAHVGDDSACAVPVGCSADGGSPGAKGETRGRRSVRLQRTEMRQLASPCPLFGAPVLQQRANQDGQRDTGQGPSG